MFVDWEANIFTYKNVPQAPHSDSGYRYKDLLLPMVPWLELRGN